MTDRIQISAVAYHGNGVWVAQCLEYDIAAFASSAADLPRALDRAVAENLCVNVHLGRDGLDGIDPAPQHFRDMFEGETLPIARGKVTIEMENPAVEIVDFRLAA